MCNGYSLQDFLEIFTDDLLKNDRIVVNFHKRLLDKYNFTSVVHLDSKSGGSNDYSLHVNKLDSCVQSCSPKLATLYLL